MVSFSFRRVLTPLIHVLLWGVFGLTLLLFQPFAGRVVLPPQFWMKQALVFAMWVAAFYFTARVSVPRLLFRGHAGWFVAVLLGTAVAVTLLTQAIESWLNLPALMEQALHQGQGGQRPGGFGGPGGSPRRRFDAISMLMTLLVLGISTSITAVQKWQHDARQRQELEQQQVSSELSFLKAQINPHFFFNTLNNIYALTLLDGDAARVALHTLSRMMRYVLYDTTAGTTPLSKEIAFLQDYVTLMRLRLTNKVDVVLELPEPVMEVPVAPMVLLPFVENAFKHGVSATEASHIHIAVRQPASEVLELDVRNSRFATPVASLEESNGIGLANTRRRLDLLYPGRYTLLVTDPAAPDPEFLVHLTLHVAPFA
ncbi:histidine kinase [Microvirga sp. STR05]|uniref:Histidine kinase n=1 Tax=Hymenobacter duratus TaxID=2771356 RepID=A0ABR8JHG4_9BACT|nr:histidine kinase [Hymenobacter duratus]MBD2715181.1 histidine kinase [Hymenobacter duratus]MBR7950088.1 histidine kinase [Microvirga sp. STR05]